MLPYQPILDKISEHQPAILNETSLSAAVMILLLYDDAQILEIVLTKRTDTLPTYAGDYSFPGGMRDTTDVDLLRTAERELIEELNILPESYQFLGQLDDFMDRFEQLVRPYVAIMSKDEFEKNYILSSEEIISLYYFPIDKLMEIADTPNLYQITKRRPSYSFVHGDVFVWGLTASMLVHLSNVIFSDNRPLGKKIV